MKLVQVIASLTLLGFASPSVAQWREVETAHFLIVSESPAPEVAKFAERLEKYDKLMRLATGTPQDDPVKVRIYEVASTYEIEQALGLADSGVAGFYDSNALGPFAVTPRKTREGGRYFTPALVLHHEYAHHFMPQYFPAIYPGWYTEGFAELIASSQELGDGRIGYGMPAKQRGNEIAAYWVPLTELLTKEEVGVDRYAQGWALTHFFTFNKDRAAQLRAYLTAISSGKTHAQAAQVFGDLNALNREARRYVTTGSFEYKSVKTEIDAPVIKRVRNLSAGEAALIDETIALRDDELSVYRKAGARKQEENLRRANLAKVSSTSLRFPNDPFALHLLSESEFASDNFAQAEAAADRLLVVSPNHVAGLARKSILLSMAAAKLSGSHRDAKAREARQMAAKANRLDKLNPMPLLAYYQSYNLAGQKPPQIAVEGLTQAVTMLPRNNSVRQLLVDQLARERRYDEAIAWLLPIANSPHDSPRRDAARQLRGKLEASRSQGKVAG